MNVFSTLFRYEIKKQFPIGFKRGKRDFVGFLLSFLITALIIGLFIFFMSVIAKNYVAIKVDKIVDKESRAYELLNLFYTMIIVAMFFVCLEQMRRTLTDSSDKGMLLRLPVKEQTLFLSKFLVLLLQNYITGFLFIVPVNIIICAVTTNSIVFWLSSILVLLTLPLIVLLLASIFIVPYIKIIDAIKRRYVLMFLLLTVLLSALFVFYMMFLSALQGYLETGYIKFLFNEKFMSTLQKLTLFSYPANCLAGIVVGRNILSSVLVLVVCVLIGVCCVYFVSKKLFHITLYKDNQRKAAYKKSNNYKQLSVLASLIKKEFVSVGREPKHIFSYLVIAATMPVMVYCCYTLFETLIYNILGLTLAFPLAIFVVLIFSVLTNTFCSTNVTREGISILKQKTLPIKVSNILRAKIIFCLIVSLLSVLISVTMLIIATSLSVLDGIACLLIGAIFSASQILLATKLDLKNVNLSLSKTQIEKQSSRTITKVICAGLIVAMVVGIGSIVCGVFAKGVLTSANIAIDYGFVYIIPCIVCTLYFIVTVLYYYRKIQKAFDRVSR
ncbi:MAG: hypothetical protein IJD48_01990 [Clostridia bacterium]|nr:hypothetical protein [Clostridia bacterium]